MFATTLGTTLIITTTISRIKPGLFIRITIWHTAVGGSSWQRRIHIWSFSPVCGSWSKELSCLMLFLWPMLLGWSVRTGVSYRFRCALIMFIIVGWLMSFFVWLKCVLAVWCPCCLGVGFVNVVSWVCVWVSLAVRITRRL